ncbi:hypothetical protein F4V91_08545 [Neorhizobium galegae]|uniref:Uncharacterized protein n=1 Tax=Neorhizobium galegae TaxID=399 RepID=A0A6A1TPE1_NEOGA|nr:hypothetical protein [Neorhizobium galegae]KAB1086473.1 hypothetical protein F4V91_08545 [Neorhizobium galegae]
MSPYLSQNTKNLIAALHSTPRPAAILEQTLRGLVMRVPGGAVLLVIPIIAVLLFGASVAWDQLDKIDPVTTGSVRSASDAADR